MSALPTAPERTLRGGDIQQVFALLQQQERHKVDVVVSTSLLRSYQGNFDGAGMPMPVELIDDRRESLGEHDTVRVSQRVENGESQGVDGRNAR